MTQHGQQLAQLSLRRRIHRRLLILRRWFRRVLEQLLRCPPLKKPIRYRMLAHGTVTSSSIGTPEGGFASVENENVNVTPVYHHHSHDKDSDLVALKISLLGDCQIGKTSFLVKYVGQEQEALQNKGLNMMDKTLLVGGARISYCIWEVEGDKMSRDHIPAACKDSVAMLFMFDLTSRCTLNNIIKWHQEARKWNQTAIPVLIGTKFDEFIQLPIDLQWTIASQARKLAKALNATLFFSSATYNINVNKIFKFITAKLFDLPWTVERNLTVGEPIIDF